MRIVVDIPDIPKQPIIQSIAMSTFDDAKAAVAYMRRQLQVERNPGVILTRRAAEELLEKYYDRIDEMPFYLMRSIDTNDDDPNEDGSLNFTSVESGDIDSIHDDMPCGAEIREYVRGYECWQLWMR